MNTDPIRDAGSRQARPVKALSKADRLRYHQRTADGFDTLSGEIPAIRALLGVTLLPYLVPTQPQPGGDR
jgi:hypothetical protein